MSKKNSDKVCGWHNWGKNGRESERCGKPVFLCFPGQSKGMEYRICRYHLLRLILGYIKTEDSIYSALEPLRKTGLFSAEQFGK
jgi:hypothetical protein